MGVIQHFIRNKWEHKETIVGLSILRILYAFLSLATPELLRQATNAIEMGEIRALSWVIAEAVAVTLLYICVNYWYQIKSRKYINKMEGILQKEVILKQYRLEKRIRSGYSIGDMLTYAIQNVPEAVQNTLETLFTYAEGFMVIFSGAVYMLVLDWRMGSLVILYAIQNVPEAVQNTLETLFTYAEGFMVIFSGAVYMLVLDWRMGSLVILYDILFRLVTLFYDKKIQRITEKGIDISKRNTSFLMDILQNNIIIRIFGRKKYYLNLLNEREEEDRKNADKQFAFYQSYEELQWACKSMANLILLFGLGSWMVFLNEREEEDRKNADKQFAFYQSYEELQWACKSMANLILLFGLGSWMVSIGEMEFSVIIAFTMATDYFAKGIIKWTEAIVYKNKAIPNILSLEEFLEQKEESEKQSGTEHGDKMIQESEGKKEPLIEMKGVTFSFGDKKILDHADLKLYKGEWIQVVGANGEGKSTFLQILAGVYLPQEGQILVRGCNDKKKHQRYLLDNCVYIPQVPQIINGSIWENLSLDEEVEKKRAERIVKEIHLEKVKDELPEMYSQGEKQRLCIGRAFYHIKQDSIILGDEIFSSIDSENRFHIAKQMQQYGQGKTILFVCHETMGIPFDRTIRLENGKICEEGGEV